MPTTQDIETFLKKASLSGVLENICQQIELTQTQFDLAESRYRAVGTWLESAHHPVVLKTSSIYPQGSVGLGTTVKPIGQEEFDVDLVCHLPHFSDDIPPSHVKAIVGDRLKQHEHYRSILDEKPRCWRLDYANEFHLDITPSIPNPHCPNRGELVADKKENRWKPTNPKGYRAWFEKKVEIVPRFRLHDLYSGEIRAKIEALPQPSSLRGVLRRTVQLCKRHRDTWTARTGSEYAPISIILTTLAAKAYEDCILTGFYDTDFDLFLDVVKRMPSFIQAHRDGGRTFYAIWNETTSDENFAEKWNHNQKLAEAFYSWHRSAETELLALPSLRGMHNVRESLSESFGERIVNRALEPLVAATQKARKTGRLSIVPGVGLTTGSSTGTRIRSNTFYGG